MYDDGWTTWPPPGQAAPAWQSLATSALHGPDRLDAQKGADILGTAVDGYSSTVTYRRRRSRRAEGIAQVKLAGLGTRVFYCGTQLRYPRQSVEGPRPLWQDVSEAVAAFFATLREHQAAEDVIMLLWTSSAAGARQRRRTDHGAGGHAFVIASGSRRLLRRVPVAGESDLMLGNLKYGIDFRSAYSSI